MPQKRAVVALGGNALLQAPLQKGTIEEQLANVDTAALHLVKLFKDGYQIVLTHGNGPQVGNLLIQQDRAKDIVPELPLYICVAETQGQIGAMFQEALSNKLHQAKLTTPVVTVITHVQVDPKDKAFKKPTKPVGPFYSYKDYFPRDWVFAKTSNGYRRVVASPAPLVILEAAEIEKIAESAIVIACGGGGIPVVKEKAGMKGVDAVIDKDLASAKLAIAFKADLFLILTNVDYVSLNYQKPDQKSLRKVTIADLKKYQKQGHFAEGSMGPKIEAAIEFLTKIPKANVIITSSSLLEQALAGEAGTHITAK
ncbi:MAG: carbamate kinase [Nanoarchaeota archaeon]|nr:carbamate kinase [Nanoarchaeota archaeon]